MPPANWCNRSYSNSNQHFIGTNFWCSNHNKKFLTKAKFTKMGYVAKSWTSRILMKQNFTWHNLKFLTFNLPGIWLWSVDLFHGHLEMVKLSVWSMESTCDLTSYCNLKVERYSLNQRINYIGMRILNKVRALIIHKLDRDKCCGYFLFLPPWGQNLVWVIHHTISSLATKRYQLLWKFKFILYRCLEGYSRTHIYPADLSGTANRSFTHAKSTWVAE